MSVLGKCDSCGQLDNCMLYQPGKKWLCDECWSEYETIDEPDDECDQCGRNHNPAMSNCCGDDDE